MDPIAVAYNLNPSTEPNLPSIGKYKDATHLYLLSLLDLSWEIKGKSSSLHQDTKSFLILDIRLPSGDRMQENAAIQAQQKTQTVFNDMVKLKQTKPPFSLSSEASELLLHFKQKSHLVK